MSRFRWTTFDVTDLLPEGWASQIVDTVHARAHGRTLRAASTTSREATPTVEVPVLGVSGRDVASCLPWLRTLYLTELRALVESVSSEPVSCAVDERYGVVLNVQAGTDMRYECHVDSNPMEGLLYFTSHPPGSGGELVVARDARAHSMAEIDRDCSVVHPVAGHFIVFDAREHPHYVRPLVDEGLRVVAAMNFYTPSCPESHRPPDLNRHLFGED